MKVLWLADAASIHTKRWVSSLNASGLNIALFSLSTDNSDYYQKHGIKTYCNNLLGNRSISKMFYLSVLNRLKEIVKKEKPDIVHAHYASSYGLLGALVGFHPYVLSVWGSDVYDFPRISFLHKNILKYNLRKADFILSTSHVMAKETSKYISKEILVTPFGVDTQLFKKISGLQNDNEYVIGNVKTLSPKYGIDILVRAFKIVVDCNKGKNINLEIIGTGPDREKLEQLTRDLGLKDKVHFIGRIENTCLPDYYNRFLVSVSLSILNSESFGVVAVEAMACECPVITSDADGFTEVVKDGETGFIVPKRNIEETAKAIQRFIDDPMLRNKMGRKGRKRVIELYDWNKNVENMISIYNAIIHKYI